MRPLHRTLLLLIAAWPLSSFAQSTAPSWLEDTLYGSGKINTVVAVVAVVLLGLAIWMAAFDRRIGRLEKRMKKD